MDASRERLDALPGENLSGDSACDRRDALYLCGGEAGNNRYDLLGDLDRSSARIIL